jgi:hypothetical protein
MLLRLDRLSLPSLLFIKTILPLDPKSHSHASVPIQATVRFAGCVCSVSMLGISPQICMIQTLQQTLSQSQCCMQQTRLYSHQDAFSRQLNIPPNVLDRQLLFAESSALTTDSPLTLKCHFKLAFHRELL